MDARAILDSIIAYQQSGKETNSSSKNYRMATIDPGFTVGKPRVIFDGEFRMGERTYSWDGSYTPKAGDRVLMLPVANTYIIFGTINKNIPFPRWIPIETVGSWDILKDFWHPLSVTKTTGNVVMIQGQIVWTGPKLANFSYAPESLVATVPEPFRPKHTIWVPASYGGTDGSYKQRIELRPNGELHFVAYKAYFPPNGTHTQGATVNISFSLEDTERQQSVLQNRWEKSLYGQQITVKKDSLDRIWFTGDVAHPEGSSPTAGNQLVANVPVGYRPSHSQYFSVSTGGTHEYWNVLPNGNTLWMIGTTKLHQGLQNIMYSEASSGGWNTLPLVNGWQPFGAPFAPPSYKLHSDGMVEVRGLVKSGTFGIEKAIGKLPEGFRPGRTVAFSSVGDDKHYRLIVNWASGTVGIVSSNATVTAPSWMSLDGIKFIAEPFDIDRVL